MKIADGIEMLEISMNFMGRDRIIYPTLIWDNDTVVLLDAGAPDNLSDIKKSMQNAGVPFETLNKIIVTHQDFDHIGGIKSILQELPNVKVFAHKEDRPYIEGDKEILKLKRIMKQSTALPEEDREKLVEMFENLGVKVDTTLSDDEELTDCGGIIAIHTPGHTPGHLCLYHKKSKTLIAGDSMNIEDGKLTGPNKQSMNVEERTIALESLKKLEKYDIENVVTYHGGLYNSNPIQVIKDLNQGYLND